jgi:glutamate--cysteine ligase
MKVRHGRPGPARAIPEPNPTESDPMKSGSSEDDRPIASRDDLEAVFHASEKPRSEWRIGGEAEKFGVDRVTGAPITYEGSRGVRRIFDALVDEHGWKPEAETEGGPVIALARGASSITLEPGAQLELSGAPYETVHEIVVEMREHLDELARVSSDMNVVWLGVGFHPTAPQAELPWVPKHRYGIMKRYLPTRGSRGLDMMQRTATVQANFDYGSEADAMQKLVVLLRLAPVIHAMTANSPFIEGRVSPLLSERGDVWLHMDPSRSGLVPLLWKESLPRYADYVEWALDAGMFLFRRGDVFIENTGQTFRSFLADGYAGHRPTLADWHLHLNTLFPEGRLKRTIEMRACDMLPIELVGAVPALCTGLLYDARSLDRATELALELSLEDVVAARPALLEAGLRGSIGGVRAQDIAERIFEIAEAGLAARARPGRDFAGEDERVHLRALGELLGKGRTPAEAIREGLSPGDRPDVRDLLARARI